MSPEGQATSAIIIAIAALVAAVLSLSVALNAIRHSSDARDDAIQAKALADAAKQRTDADLNRLLGYVEADRRHTAGERTTPMGITPTEERSLQEEGNR